jgi:hypothetical protein
MSDSLIEFKSGNKWFVDALNKVVSYARGHGVNPAGVPGWSWTVDGWQPPRFRVIEGMGEAGFLVKPSGEDGDITVTPSVVSGMGAWATIPVIGSTPLTALPAPVLSASGAEWIALRMEVQPVGDMYFNDGDTQLWRVAEGAGLLIGNIEVLAFSDAADMESQSTPASVNQSDGSPDSNGIYIIPLANNNGSGWKQVGYTGPLGVRMCANGAFIALSPARGPAVTIEPPE